MLVESGVDFIVVGSLVFSLKLKKVGSEDDVDVLCLSPDPVFEEDFYSSLADERGWDYGRTWAGTPRLIPPGSVPLEVYGNFMEFEVPQEFMEELLTWRVKGVEFRSVNVEQNIVLKARGALVNEKHKGDLKALAKKRDIKYSRDKVVEYLGYYEEGVKRAMERILQETGIIS